MLWLSALGLLVFGGLFVLVLGYAGLVVLSAMATQSSVVPTLLDLAIPFVPVLGVLLVATVLSGVGVAWGLLHGTSRGNYGRLKSLVERAEREYSELRVLGLSDALEPPEPTAEERAEDALERLRRQYVEGEIDEREFERKVDRLVANESLDEAKAAHERREVLGEREY